jgi:hypothetical protein
MVFGASALSGASALQAAWMHCLCCWLMGGRWAGLVRASPPFECRSWAVSAAGGVDALPVLLADGRALGRAGESVATL